MNIKGAPIKIVVCDHDVNWMLETTQELNLYPQIKVVGFAQNGTALLERVVELDVNVVLTEASLPDMTAIEIAQRLKSIAPQVKVFAATRSMTSALVTTLKSGGIIDVFPKDNISVKEIAQQITGYVNRPHNKESSYRPQKQEKTTRPKDTARTVILTYNTKGGVGKSTIAANLAVAIKTSPYYGDKKVCLVDFDAGGANVVTNVHLTDADAANRNIAAWDYMPENITAKELDSYLLDGPRGLKIAAAPVNQAIAETIDLSLADKILRVLKKYYTVIVVDGAPNISPLIDSALVHSTHILMVTNPEGQSVRQLSRVIRLLSPDANNPNKPDMSHILRKMFLVINYAQNPTSWDLKPNEVAELVGQPVYAQIPYDEIVRQALHGTEQKTAVELAPNSNFTKAIKQLANNICNAYPGGFQAETNQDKRKGFLGGLFA